MIAQIKVEMMTVGYATILSAFNALIPYPLINAPIVFMVLFELMSKINANHAGLIVRLVMLQSVRTTMTALHV
jgi:hypothetical protein